MIQKISQTVDWFLSEHFFLKYKKKWFIDRCILIWMVLIIWVKVKLELGLCFQLAALYFSSHVLPRFCSCPIPLFNKNKLRRTANLCFKIIINSDNTTLFSGLNSIPEAEKKHITSNNELKYFTYWLASSKLLFYVNKTKYMIFTHSFLVFITLILNILVKILIS